MKLFYQYIFWILAYLGKPIGGFRPHRVYHWLAHRGFNQADILSGKKYKMKTSWGGVMVVHPFYFLDREIIVTGCYDKPLHNFLNQYIRPGMIVLDVGANIGDIAIHMAKLVEADGSVYAFEPAPTILTRLRENVRLNSLEGIIKIHDIALSNVRTQSLFSFADINAENQGMGSLVNRENDVVSCEIEVKTERLDEFVIDAGLKRIDFIKVDIQGGEVAFIEGAAKTLLEMGPDIVMEISSSDLVKINKTPGDLLRSLEQFGYQFYLFDKYGVSGDMVTSSSAESTQMSLNIYCTKNQKLF